MVEEDVTLGRLLLTEYQSIKEEQKARIGFRDNLLYVTLTVVAVVVAAAAQAKQTAMLLALPPVCVVLGWTYLVNDEKITAIGRYIRNDLGPRLAQLAYVEKTFGWEFTNREDPGRRFRKIIQCVVDLLAFCVVPLSALVAYWSGGQTAPGLLILSVGEALAVSGLGGFIVRFAVPFGSESEGR
ncbi:hypothetical protein [Streptomyces sp. NPDC047043]|uniref:hypothetical protein n=1 Tax=Streptomyces sp. NPDC047043 TaxID=3154497 RepID=UPI0033C9C2ED